MRGLRSLYSQFDNIQRSNEQIIDLEVGPQTTHIRPITVTSHHMDYIYNVYDTINWKWVFRIDNQLVEVCVMFSWEPIFNLEVSHLEISDSSWNQTWYYEMNILQNSKLRNNVSRYKHIFQQHNACTSHKQWHMEVYIIQQNTKQYAIVKPNLE